MHIFIASVFVVYSFFSPIITVGWTMITTNILHIGWIDLVKAAWLTSCAFMFNGLIWLTVYSKDIVWRDVRYIFPVSLLWWLIGSIFLVNISPVTLLWLMLITSVYYIYKRLSSTTSNHINQDSFWREQCIGLFAGCVTWTGLPGWWFLNTYFASKGFTLSQMYGTLSFIQSFVFLIKVSILFWSGVLISSDLHWIFLATPFLIITSILVRRWLVMFSKATTDKITLATMIVFAVYISWMLTKAIL